MRNSMVSDKLKQDSSNNKKKDFIFSDRNLRKILKNADDIT